MTTAPPTGSRANLTEDQLKNSVTISQSVEDASATHIVFDHPFTFNDDLAASATAVNRR